MIIVSLQNKCSSYLSSNHTITVLSLSKFHILAHHNIIYLTLSLPNQLGPICSLILHNFNKCCRSNYTPFSPTVVLSKEVIHSWLQHYPTWGNWVYKAIKIFRLLKISGNFYWNMISSQSLIVYTASSWLSCTACRTWIAFMVKETSDIIWTHVVCFFMPAHKCCYKDSPQKC